MLYSGPFTALVREAVVGPALMSGVLSEFGTRYEPRLRGFSMLGLEPGAMRWGLKPCEEKPGKPG